MKLFHFHLFRTFVFLLLTVFVANTVYAGGMMTSVAVENLAESVAENVEVQQSVNQHEQHAHHCHDQQQTKQKSQSHTGCDSCNHCLACFSIIPQSQLRTISIPKQMILAIVFEKIYLSPVRAQPQKPPIA